MDMYEAIVRETEGFKEVSHICHDALVSSGFDRLVRLSGLDQTFTVTLQINL